MIRAHDPAILMIYKFSRVCSPDSLMILPNNRAFFGPVIFVIRQIIRVLSLTIIHFLGLTGPFLALLFLGFQKLSGLLTLFFLQFSRISGSPVCPSLIFAIAQSRTNEKEAVPERSGTTSLSTLSLVPYE